VKRKRFRKLAVRPAFAIWLGLWAACIMACHSLPKDAQVGPQPAVPSETVAGRSPEPPAMPDVIDTPQLTTAQASAHMPESPRASTPEAAPLERRSPVLSALPGLSEPIPPGQTVQALLEKPAANAPAAQPAPAAASMELAAPRSAAIKPDPKPEAPREKRVFPARPGLPAAPPAEAMKKSMPLDANEIIGLKGREFTIQLPGSGWLYLAERDSGRRIELQRKIAADESTSFVFLSWEPGDYLLRFQQQNLAANIVRSSSRSVSVRDEMDAPLRVPAAQPEPSRPPAEAVQDKRGEEIARIEQALLGPGDQQAGRDRLLFVLAASYEEEGPHKNVKKALALYQTIVEKYPLSPHYRDAWARAQYLTRQYFDVR
jgi:hypothetical protein